MLSNHHVISYHSNFTFQGKHYKGWSTKVLHGTNNKFGWSEELLEYGSSDGAAEDMSSGGEDNEPCNNATEGSSPSSATSSSSSSSGGGAKSWAGRKPWNTSPKRTFVRNFP